MLSYPIDQPFMPNFFFLLRIYNAMISALHVLQISAMLPLTFTQLAHERRMHQMERDLNRVMQEKVRDKEQKLREQEQKLLHRHEEMQRDLEEKRK